LRITRIIIIKKKKNDNINNNNDKILEYTWDNIRQRNHSPAPIILHLATRQTESPREQELDKDLEHPMYDFNEWKDELLSEDELNEQKATYPIK